jgi:hypothetical protein
MLSTCKYKSTGYRATIVAAVAAAMAATVATVMPKWNDNDLSMND